MRQKNTYQHDRLSRIDVDANTCGGLHDVQAIKKQSKACAFTLKQIYQAIGQLRCDFPNCFQKPPHVKPLAIGLHKILLKYYAIQPIENLSTKLIRTAISWYTRQLSYLMALKHQNIRVDLQGNPIGVVTDKEREYAINCLRRYYNGKRRLNNDRKRFYKIQSDQENRKETLLNNDRPAKMQCKNLHNTKNMANKEPYSTLNKSPAITSESLGNTEGLLAEQLRLALKR